MLQHKKDYINLHMKNEQLHETIYDFLFRMAY